MLLRFVPGLRDRGTPVTAAAGPTFPLDAPGCRVGMLTPSSNTVLEGLCFRMTADLPGVSVHFSRFRVTEISLAERGLQQFDAAPMLAAADLLADAEVDAIVWKARRAGGGGSRRTSGCARRSSTPPGSPATTSVLALNDALRAVAARRISFSVMLDVVSVRRPPRGQLVNGGHDRRHFGIRSDCR